MNVRNNVRFLSTDKEIQTVFFDILREDPNGHISVRQICERAEMNRSTFYSHFCDVFDVAESIEKSLIDELLNGFNENLRCSKTVFSRRSLCILTEFLKAHREFYYIASKSERYFPNRRLFAAFWNLLIDKEKAEMYVGGTEEQINCFIFFLSGLSGILQRWIDNGCRTETEELVEMIMKCIPDCWRRETLKD